MDSANVNPTINSVNRNLFVMNVSLNKDVTGLRLQN